MFVNGCTGVIIAINYLTGTTIEDGSCAPTYAGSGIAETNGKGPVCPAETGDAAKVG